MFLVLTMMIGMWLVSADVTGAGLDVDPDVAIVEERVARAQHENRAVQPDEGLLHPHPPEREDVAENDHGEGDQYHEEHQPGGSSPDPLVDTVCGLHKES